MSTSGGSTLIGFGVLFLVTGLIVAGIIYYKPIVSFNHFTEDHPNYVTGDSILIPVGTLPSNVKIIHCESSIPYKNSMLVNSYTDWYWFVNKSKMVFSCFDSYSLTYHTYTVYNGKYIVLNVDYSIIPSSLRDYAGTIVKGNTVYYTVNKNLIKSRKMGDVETALLLFGGFAFVFIFMGLIEKYQ